MVAGDIGYRESASDHDSSHGVSGLRRKRLFVGSALVLVIIGLSVGALVLTNHLIGTSVRGSLRAILDTVVSGVEMWRENREAEVRNLVADGLFGARLRTLWERTGTCVIGDEPLASLMPTAHLGYVLVDAQGVVRLASSESLAQVGSSTAITALITRAHDTLVISTPLTLPGGGSEAYTVVAAPVIDSASRALVGVVAIFYDPVTGLAGVLEGASPGASGETYLVSPAGTMLSWPMQISALRKLQVPIGEEGTIGTISLRDPGRQLTPTEPFSGSVVDLPLTSMALEMSKGRDGESLDGYRDYRGVPVLGVWRWLPESGLGVATEIDLDEAYRPLRVLEIIFGLAVLATGVAGLFAVSLWHRAARAERHVALVERRVESLGQYRIERKLAEGGMGEVFLATHALLCRPTAVKVIRNQRTDEEALERFRREVHLTSQLSHPNTVTIYDYGCSEDGSLFYAMEYLRGVSLLSLVKDHGPQPAGRVIHLLVQACGSLAEAHRHGLVHRDIKPGNIFLTVRGGICDFVKVLDFGLAKDLADESGERLTRPDLVCGSPSTMPPEIAGQKGAPSARSDLYSLSCVAYQLLTGQNVFDEANALALIMAHLSKTPALPSTRIAHPIPADLEALVMKGLSKDPKDRQTSAEAYAKELRQCSAFGTWGEEQARQWWRQYGRDFNVDVDQLADPGEETAIRDLRPTSLRVPIQRG